MNELDLVEYLNKPKLFSAWESLRKEGTHSTWNSLS